jgi:hypothetical protein
VRKNTRSIFCSCADVKINPHRFIYQILFRKCSFCKKLLWLMNRFFCISKLFWHYLCIIKMLFKYWRSIGKLAHNHFLCGLFNCELLWWLTAIILNGNIVYHYDVIYEAFERKLYSTTNWYKSRSRFNLKIVHIYNKPFIIPINLIKLPVC